MSLFPFGEVTEWTNVPDSKSGVPQGTGGSNPSLSATKMADWPHKNAGRPFLCAFSLRPRVFG